jgi:3-oxoacyl-[acyl-carrier-protein] synthase-3
MSGAYITEIEYSFPRKTLGNEEIADTQSSNWTADKIFSKTGIKTRHVSDKDEHASDFAIEAADRIFKKTDRSQIDYLIYCTQSPEYIIPTNACIIQDKLGLSTTCGALDINLGCSGYVYGLGLAKALIDSSQANNILFLTGDTYSKYINSKDNSVRTLFGDAGTATLISNTGSCEISGPFVYGTDGKGKNNLILNTRGTKMNYDPNSPESVDMHGNVRTINDLYMNGPEIFSFTSTAVPKLVNSLHVKFHSQIDFYVFHQANAYMLKHLQKLIKIPDDKFFIDMENCGNTVSSTIPIAFKNAIESGKIKDGFNVMLVGFGVGYSWGGTVIKYKK